MTSERESAALAEFPELRRLIDLRQAGWTFIPVIADGEIIEVRGVRTWPGIFRRLLHYVPNGARRTRLGGGWAYVAECGALCCPPANLSLDGFKPCPECSRTLFCDGWDGFQPNPSTRPSGHSRSSRPY